MCIQDHDISADEDTGSEPYDSSDQSPLLDFSGESDDNYEPRVSELDTSDFDDNIRLVRFLGDNMGELQSSDSPYTSRSFNLLLPNPLFDLLHSLLVNPLPDQVPPDLVNKDLVVFYPTTGGKSILRSRM